MENRIIQGETNDNFFVSARYIHSNAIASLTFNPISLRFSKSFPVKVFLLELYALTEDKSDCAYVILTGPKTGIKNEQCLNYKYKNSFESFNVEDNSEIEIVLERRSPSKLIDLKVWIMVDGI